MNTTKKELLHSLKFVLFSISAGIIQVASFTVMEELLHLHHWLSYLIYSVIYVVDRRTDRSESWLERIFSVGHNNDY